MTTLIKNFEASRKAKDLAVLHIEWPAKEAGGLRAIAQRQLSEHAHENYYRHTRMDVRESCAACALRGYERHFDIHGILHRHAEYMPNYAGWLRTYIQARESVPEAWFNAEIKRAEAENPAYYNAILRDIKTFGIYIGKEP